MCKYANGCPAHNLARAHIHTQQEEEKEDEEDSSEGEKASAPPATAPALPQPPLPFSSSTAAASTNLPASQLALTPTTECAFCHLTATTAEVRFGERGSELGDLVGPFKDFSEKDSHSSKSSANRSVFWVHEFCALVCPEVSQDSDSGQWYNVHQAQKRGRQIGCSHCGKRGATVRCSCGVFFHPFSLFLSFSFSS